MIFCGWNCSTILSITLRASGGSASVVDINWSSYKYISRKVGQLPQQFGTHQPHQCHLRRTPKAQRRSIHPGAAGGVDGHAGGVGETAHVAFAVGGETDRADPRKTDLATVGVTGKLGESAERGHFFRKRWLV